VEPVEEAPPLDPEAADQKAVELAYRAISRRDKTVREVRAFLADRQVEEESIDHAIGELAEAGFLDDANFAERFAEDKRGIERWGNERIERELERRGVPGEIIAQTLAYQGREDELEAAVALLADKLPPPEDDRGRDKAWRLLVRKGYDSEVAYDAVRRHESG
jgi:regulatory protein